MIVDQSAQPCANRTCACEVPAGQTYCNPQCANASIEGVAAERESCACGHRNCGVGAVSETTRGAAAIS
ncbi:MAG: hypothetical protein ABW186_01595 [Rhodanobacteraceae bacterium]